MQQPTHDSERRFFVDSPWARPWEDVSTALDVSRERGLSEAEAAQRRRVTGKNQLRESQRTSAWVVLGNQFKSIVLVLLAIAAVVSIAIGDWIEGAAIGAVIAVNAAIGFATEWQAVRSMDALRRLARRTARVRRDREIREVAAEDLVPGDIVIFEAGDTISADLRLVEASNLRVDESMLTGESVPTGKGIDPVDAGAAVTDRSNMLFKGTQLVRGSGEAVVVGTGMRTELGTIATLTEEAEQESTPLEQRLERLGRRLIWVTLSIAVAVALAGTLAGRPLALMIETSIALAVAAIPEGLPIVATLALARGMLRMARRHATVQRLAAVETLGATSVICTDKTGTLTKNELTVARIALNDGVVDLRDGGLAAEGRRDQGDESLAVTDVLRVGVLCNNAALHQDGTAVGDPLEVALLRAALSFGLDRAQLIDEMPEVREEAFDTTTKMMATVHTSRSNGHYVAVKGAPEAVLEASVSVRTADGERPLDSEARGQWLNRIDELAGTGMRVLAHADKTVPAPDAPPYEGLRLLGLVAFVDPPREDAAAAIDACRRAGIQVVMVTGDQALTARSIASAVRLITTDDDPKVFTGADIERLQSSPKELRNARVFARVTPKQKLELIEAFQRSGDVVAMTGDGVNDAPALKKADMGVAMGRRGTQVAREAADMVLEDDAFGTIVVAVRQGRVIFDNIRRFVVYLLSCNISEILLVASAAVSSAPLPILPLQILFLNLVTDVFPALALGLGEGSDEVMTRPPRRATEQILMRPQWIAMTTWATVMTAAVLGAFWLALDRLGMDDAQAITVSFLTLAFAQLWHVFNMRSPGAHPFRNDLTGNPWVWAALLVCVGLILTAVYVPAIARVLSVTPPSSIGWAVILGMSLVPVVAGLVFGRRLGVRVTIE